ncbi:MAG: adenylate/guanylate cyclase domain-containing protein, partial [Pseudomonadota bacterium]
RSEPETGADQLTIHKLHRTDKADLQLFSTLAATKARFVEFRNSGETFVGMRLPLSSQFGLEADLYVAAPLSDFNSAAYDALTYTLSITLVLTLVVLVLGTVIARAIARPICSAATAMKKVAELDLEHPVTTGTTHLSEIEMLNRSLGVMHRALSGFSKYLPRDLVRDLMQLGLPIELGGSRREITVLMTDIVGFSRTMEAADNDQLIEDLADYFDVISTTIHECGGTVDKFIGDAVMAFWGAPRSDEAHAQHACDAVITIAARLDDFNESRLALGKPAFETRFALHSGDAFVGNVGARDRFGYTALGDVVNTVSRLEKLGKAFGVQAIVSRDVAHRTRSQHKFRCLGEVRPEGKSNRIGAMELVLCSSGRPSTFGQDVKRPGMVELS